MSQQKDRSLSAAMIVIGNEILSGKVSDSNSPFLARELRRLGVSLERISVIPDDVETISGIVGEYAERYDFVFTSGGVGPTHDDVTVEGVASAFGVPVVVHPQLRATIEQVVGEDPGSSYLKMSEVPEGAELLAAGGRNFPTVVIRNVYVLPGIPEIFEAKVVALRDRFRGSPYLIRQVFVSASETAIADFLQQTLDEFPELLLGSYPKLATPDYSVRLTLESKDERYLDAALDDLISRIPQDVIIKIER